MTARVSRRGFLKLGGLTAAIGASELVLPARNVQAEGEGPSGELLGRTTLSYEPVSILETVSALGDGDVHRFNYPDEDSPCLLIKTGQACPGGVGPDADIVAYSALCSHQGCPLSYDVEGRVLQCHCHFSIFDPELNGQMICGQATASQPRILLAYDAETDSIAAVGVEGLIYGRQANLL